MTETDPVCALHPDATSVGSCVRCGDYLCDSCVAVVVDGHVVCASCRPHVRETAELPWDRRPTPTAFMRTLGQVVIEPRKTFARMAPDRVGRGFSFAMVCYLLPILVQTAARGFEDALDLMLTVLCAGLFLPILNGFIITSVVAGLVWCVAHLLGGTGRFATDVRAVGFSTPFYAAAMCTAVLPPLVQGLLAWLWLVVAAWVAWLLVTRTNRLIGVASQRGGGAI